MYLGAIDIGGTKTIVGVVGQHGQLLLKKQLPTHTASWAVHFDNCAAVLADCVRELGLALSQLSGVGVSMPGTMDCTRGHLYHAPFAGWRDVPVTDYFAKKLAGLTIRADNDVNNCARAEMRFAGAQGDFLWVTVSTGIGGAVVCGSRVICGVNNCAGELGHIKVERAKPQRCSCGAWGCLEAHASGTAIAREFAALLAQNPQAGHYPADAYGCALLAKAGGEDARAIYHRAGEYLGQALACAINMLNPARVYIGGGVSRSLELMLPAVQEAIQRDVVAQCADVKIAQTALGYEASLLGAAALLLD